VEASYDIILGIESVLVLSRYLLFEHRSLLFSYVVLYNLQLIIMCSSKNKTWAVDAREEAPASALESVFVNTSFPLPGMCTGAVGRLLICIHHKVIASN
jgi:hypothetical protein